MKPQNQNTPNNDSPFGEVIYAYTRAQAIADSTLESSETGLMNRPCHAFMQEP